MTNGNHPKPTKPSDSPKRERPEQQGKPSKAKTSTKS